MVPALGWDARDGAKVAEHYNTHNSVIYENPFIINIFKNNIYTNTDYNMIEKLIEKYNYVFVYDKYRLQNPT